MTFTTETASKLDILWLNSNSLCMDGSQIGVFKQTNKVSLGSFLERSYCCRLKTQVSLEVLGDFTNKSLERELADQELSGLLVTTDFSESNSSRTITMRFLDTSSGWCSFSIDKKGKVVLLVIATMLYIFSLPFTHRADLEANCFLGAFPPTDFLAVCLVLAMLTCCWWFPVSFASDK